MRRWKLILPILAVFAAGWTLGSSRSQTADARPKPKVVPAPKPAAAASCKDELARVRRELAAAQADVQAARADAATARQERDTLVARERERLGRFEATVGTPIQTLE